MRAPEIVDLADCTEFREAVLAAPPAAARLSPLLLAALLTTAVTWAAASRVDVVVRARGVVRPPEPPQEARVAIGGTVREVLFQEGARIPAGAPLLVLDREKLRAQVAELERGRAAAEEELERALSVQEALSAARDRELAQAETGIEIARLEAEQSARRRDQAQRSLELARAAASMAAREVARFRELLDHGVVSRAEAERRVDALEAERIRELAAEEDLRSAELDIALAKKRVLATQQERDSLTQAHRTRLREQEIRIGESRSRLGAQEHAARLLELDLELCTVRAPISGIVVTDGPRPGDLLAAGEVVARIAPPGVVVEALVPNSRIAGLHRGQRVRVKLDAYDWQRHGALEGEVAFIAPDATLLEDASGMATSVYRVTVHLAAASATDPSRPIELGMTGTAEIVTGRDRILDLALRRLRRESDVR